MEPSVKDKDKDKHKLSMNAHALHDLALFAQVPRCVCVWVCVLCITSLSWHRSLPPSLPPSLPRQVSLSFSVALHFHPHLPWAFFTELWASVLDLCPLPSLPSTSFPHARTPRVLRPLTRSASYYHTYLSPLSLHVYVCFV